MTDVDECSLNYCDQTCTNTIGSFVCECDIGFELGSDLLTCTGTYMYICTCTHTYRHACINTHHTYTCT